MGRKSKKDKDLEKDEGYKFQGTGLVRAEKFWAGKQFENYKDKYHIESLADLQLLEELVFREALQQRYKKKIETIETEYKKVKAKGSKTKSEVAPKTLTYALDKNLEQILILREKLGLFNEKKEKDSFTYIKILKKKFEKWMEKHKASRTFPCLHCGKIIMLRIRTDIYDAQKHAFFQGRFLANKNLWDLYKKGKITEQDVADVLGTPLDYVRWLKKKIFRED